MARGEKLAEGKNIQRRIAAPDKNRACEAMGIARHQPKEYTMGEQEKRETPLQHKVRICKLSKDGKMEEVEALSLKPIVFCKKCQAKSDDPSYLCNPRALKSK